MMHLDLFGEKLRFSPTPKVNISSEKFDLYYDITGIFGEEKQVPDCTGGFYLVGEDSVVRLQLYPEDDDPDCEEASYSLWNFNYTIQVDLPTENTKDILKTILKKAKKDGKLSHRTRVVTGFPFLHDSVKIEATKVTITRDTKRDADVGCTPS
jgi:hypothetical protein